MKKINVEIQGLSPLLMNNIMSADLSGTSRKTLKTYNPEEEAKKSAYWFKEGKRDSLCVPARCLYACLRNSASYFKTKGRNLKPVIAGAVRIEPEFLSLGTDKYTTDTQSVVIQKARVLRSRARVDNWKLNFQIIYNEDYIGDADILKKILVEAGVKVGLLDYRPQKSGNYGTFEVTKFEEAD